MRVDKVVDHIQALAQDFFLASYALPNPYNPPAGRAQFVRDTNIARDLGGEFGLPELGSRRRRAGVPAARMLLPKVPLDTQRELVT